MPAMLHDLASCLRAPTVALSGRDGQIRPGGIEGVFHADVRVLSEARLLIGGREPDGLVNTDDGAGRASFVGLASHLGTPGPDPTVRVTRRRTVHSDGMAEELEIASTAEAPVELAVRLEVACDLADVTEARQGRAPAATEPIPLADGVRWQGRDEVAVTLTGDGARLDSSALCWQLRLDPRQTTAVRWRLRVQDRGRVVVPGDGAVPWTQPRVRADDHRVAALLGRALADLDTLRLATAELPDAPFLGAGAPWFFTLFGRDSLLAARMLLPLGTGLAASTLRALAHYQGSRYDPETGEAPGKIMHELRREAVGSLPPVYYGTVDATLLWVLLLHDAWRWGLAPEVVESLLPHLDAAMGWLAESADPDGDGFIEYVDESGHGLANQGWKDSGDAVRFRDGRIASGPIALCEVQGYAYEAARDAAALLDAFGRTGADGWRRYADGLAERFRARFWVADERGRYPALALDRDKRPVDAVTSNIGHLLGTGLLDEREAKLVASRLVSADMSSGYGLRTMSTDSAGYSPLSYHCGSVWPHDTAIVAAGLMRQGQPAEAAAMAMGLLRAAPEFGYRLPELFGGDASADTSRPVPYPAACRPQAWSAAAAVLVLQVLLGLEVDVPGGGVQIRPATPSPVGALRVDGLAVGGDRVAIEIDREGRLASVTGTDLPVRTGTDLPVQAD